MAARKARKPKCKKSEYPTLTGKPQLGYLNAYYCPVCGKHLFSAYDADLRKDREDGYYFYRSYGTRTGDELGDVLRKGLPGTGTAAPYPKWRQQKHP